jgi:sugar phosphate isomerase/epimerase
MIPGYHTAGLLLHDVCVAIDELAHIGYGCVAIRPHGGILNPRLPGFSQQVLRIADAISKADVRSVLDIDAPYLHDPQAFAGPSLVADDDAECDASLRWVEQWVEVAGELGTKLVTFGSGAPGGSGFEKDEQVLERLAAHLDRLTRYADDRRVRLAIRPRHGHAIATVAQFERLGQWLDDADNLFLAADVGEMLIGGELPLVDRLARNRDMLACVYLCDRRAGHAGDQRIGHGDVALGRILRSLALQEYQGSAIIRVEGCCELGFLPAREAIEVFDSAESRGDSV